jgi:uncharacterized radical SAM superfamily Fe-S cluster-containing enzyme
MASWGSHTHDVISIWKLDYWSEEKFYDKFSKWEENESIQNGVEYYIICIQFR